MVQACFSGHWKGEEDSSPQVWKKWKFSSRMSRISYLALVHLYASGCLPQQSPQGSEEMGGEEPAILWYIIGLGLPVTNDLPREFLLEGACGKGEHVPWPWETDGARAVERTWASYERETPFPQPTLSFFLLWFHWIQSKLVHGREPPYSRGSTMSLLGGEPLNCTGL